MATGSSHPAGSEWNFGEMGHANASNATFKISDDGKSGASSKQHLQQLKIEEDLVHVKTRFQKDIVAIGFEIDEVNFELSNPDLSEEDKVALGRTKQRLEMRKNHLTFACDMEMEAIKAKGQVAAKILEVEDNEQLLDQHEEEVVRNFKYPDCNEPYHEAGRTPSPLLRFTPPATPRMTPQPMRTPPATTPPRREETFTLDSGEKEIDRMSPPLSGFYSDVASERNTPVGSVDKDTLLMQLMQSQLHFLEKSKASPGDKFLPEFNGDPAQWGNFKAAVDRIIKRHSPDDSELMMRLQKVLKGDARIAVEHLMANVSNVKKILETLEFRFGRPEFVLDYLIEKVKSCNKIEQNKPESIVEFGTSVDALVSNICAFKEDDYLHSRQIVNQLVDKLPGSMKDEWHGWIEEDPTHKRNLRSFADWLKRKVRVAMYRIKPVVSSVAANSDAVKSRSRRGPGAINAAAGEEEKEEKSSFGACAACKKNHSLEKCWIFQKKKLDDKWRIAKEARVCFCCLKSGHRTADCADKKKCGKDGCTRDHHHLLHASQRPAKANIIGGRPPDGITPPPPVAVKDGASSDSSIGTASVSVCIEGTDGPLAIVPVRVRKAATGTWKTIYSLLDSGASRTLISEELAEKLQLDGPRITYRMKNMGGELMTNTNAMKVNFDISGRYRNAKFYPVTNAVTVSEIGIPPYSINIEEVKRKWPHLRKAKAESLKKVVPTLLIGGDHGFLTMHLDLLYKSIKEPVAVRTVLGWVIQGKFPEKGAVGPVMSYYVGGLGMQDELHNLIKESFLLDDFGLKSKESGMSPDDRRALQILEDTTVRKEGRWTTGLLWKNGEPLSPGISEAMTRQTEKRMKRDPEFAAVYQKKISEYLDKGFIQETTNSEEWMWIPTAENVADDGTRCDTATDLMSESRWLQGPAFLKLKPDSWPKKKNNEYDGVIAAAAGEIERDPATTTNEWSEWSLPPLFSYSKYHRLLRATAAVGAAARFWIAKIRKGKEAISPWTKTDDGIVSNLNPVDMGQAEKRLIKFAQRGFHPSKENKQPALLKHLKVFQDEHGILRVRGRITRADATPEMKNPAILPGNHHVACLIVDAEHVKNAHCGKETVFNNLRQKFWITGGRNAVKRSFARCHFCKIQRAKPVIPEMGDLPSYRLAANKPVFHFTGVDFFGPIEITVGRRHEKRWVALFTCMVTRATYLDVAAGLSKEDMMHVFSRFVDTHGVPCRMFSDNGTNFVAVEKEVAGIEKTSGMKWHFIPPGSPHFGGAWERMVQAVKKVLKNIMKDKYPREEVLRTVLRAAQNIVNSRPLTYVSNDPNDPESLTPNHFLRGAAACSSSALLGDDVGDEAEHLRNHFLRSQYYINLFWKRWSHEVLPDLIRRTKWYDAQEPVRVGDVVLLVDEQQPRNSWSKGIVTRTFEGEHDKLVRVMEVTIRHPDGRRPTVYKRSVAKICPLGIRSEDSVAISSLEGDQMGAGRPEI